MSSYTTKAIDDAITEARNLVNDIGFNGQGYRNSQVTLVTYLNTALRALYSLRPDAFIANPMLGLPTSTPIVTYDLTDLGLVPATPFPVDDRMFFSPVVIYMAGLIELADDEFTDTARSAQLMAAFKALLVAP
jgi:hypothetical protein